MRVVLTVAGTELRRFLRDRSNIFFVFIFPLALVLVIGSQFGGGGSTGEVALAGEESELRDAVARHLEDDGLVVDLVTAEEARERASRGRTDVALFVDGEASAAYQAGDPVRVEVVTSSGNAVAVEQRVRTAMEGLGLERAQHDALAGAGVPASEIAPALERAASEHEAATLRVEDVDEIAQQFSGLGQFDLGASSQLLLFTFLTCLAASATLIQARRGGVIARALAAPVTGRQLLAGQALGRWVIAFFQGGYIMLATWLLFRVDWGNVLLSALVLAVFAVVAAGAAMLLGAVMDNEGAAAGVGVGLGLVLAGIGGGMVPLELIPDTMRQVSDLTPHAWAYQAFAQIQRHDGGLVDIAPQLGVLAAMGAVLLAVGAVALRRSVERAM